MADENFAFSCDTFVVLPPLTDSNFRIFGKNSDRPANEVQEIIFVSNQHTSHIQVMKNPSDLTIYFSLVYSYSNPSSFENISMYSFETSVVLGCRNRC